LISIQFTWFDIYDHEIDINFSKSDSFNLETDNESSLITSLIKILLKIQHFFKNRRTCATKFLDYW